MGPKSYKCNQSVLFHLFQYDIQSEMVDFLVWISSPMRLLSVLSKLQYVISLVPDELDEVSFSTNSRKTFLKK